MKKLKDKLESEIEKYKRVLELQEEGSATYSFYVGLITGYENALFLAKISENEEAIEQLEKALKERENWNENKEAKN